MSVRRLVSLVAAPVIGVAGLTACSGTDETVSWNLLAASPASDRITIAYLHGACDRLDSVQVHRDRDSVRVAVTVVDDSDSCTDVGRVTPIGVRLGGPLGSRAVEGDCTKHAADRCVVVPWGFELPRHLPTYGP